MAEDNLMRVVGGDLCHGPPGGLLFLVNPIVWDSSYTAPLVNYFFDSYFRHYRLLGSNPVGSVLPDGSSSLLRVIQSFIHCPFIEPTRVNKSPTSRRDLAQGLSFCSYANSTLTAIDTAPQCVKKIGYDLPLDSEGPKKPSRRPFPVKTSFRSHFANSDGWII